MRQGAQGLCTGMTMRDGMGREVGWDGEGGGMGVQDGGHMYIHGLFVSMFGESDYNIVK